MFKDELEMLWATPVAIRVYEEIKDFNSYLEEKILELKQRDCGINKSNCLGWHSTGNLFQSLPAELNEFHQMIVQFISDYIAELNPNQNQVDVELFAWANILDKGGYHNVHTHPSSHLSGVYYINPGEPDPSNSNSGLIGFSDPRIGASMIANSYLDYGASYQYKPETGMLLMFPSYLSHWVHPFTGNGKRITISFNARFLDNLRD